MGDFNKPLSNQNLVTWKDTPVYNAPDISSAPLGVLVDNLRYPIISKLEGRLNQTSDPYWRQIGLYQRPRCVVRQRHSDFDLSTARWEISAVLDVIFRLVHRQRGITAIMKLAHLVTECLNRSRRGSMTRVFYVICDDITFDDGLKSVSRYACLVLKQYAMKATAFIISSRIKRHPQNGILSRYNL